MYEQVNIENEKARYRVTVEDGDTMRNTMISIILRLPMDVKVTLRVDDFLHAEDQDPSGFYVVIPGKGTKIEAGTMYLQSYRMEYQISGDYFREDEMITERLWLYDGWTISEKDTERVLKKLMVAQEGPRTFSIDYALSCEQETRMRRVNGEVVRINGVLYFMLRITESGEAIFLREELALEKERKDILSSLFEDWVYEYNLQEGRVTTISGNSAQYNMLGGTEKKQTYLSLEDLHPEDRRMFMECCRGVHQLNGVSYVEARIKLDGVYRWISLTTRQLCDLNGNVISVIGKISDIDAKKKEEIKLREEAMKDSLTELLNKEAFREKAEHALLGASEEKPHIAFLMIDIDDFKKVNDGFGHLYGDTVIMSMADAMREVTSGEDLLGRFGGDEFSALLLDFGSEKELEEKIKRLRELFSKSSTTENEADISCSVGVAVFGRDGVSLNELFRNADNALYYMKNNGKNGYAFCTERIKEEYSDEHRKKHPKDPIRNSSRISEEVTEFALELLEGSKDLKSAINILLAKVGKRFSLSGLTVREEDGSGGFSLSYVWHDEKKMAAVEDEAMMSQSDWKQIVAAFKENQTIEINDLEELPKENAVYRLYHGKGVKSILQCPLFSEGVLFGNISYSDCVQTRVWSEEEKHSLVVISKIIGNYLARERAYQKIEHKVELMKSYDEVTGLLKYDKFKEVAQNILSTGNDMVHYAIVSTDFSHFKFFNEIYGFRSGDELLADFANLVVKHNQRAVAASRDYADSFVIMVTVSDEATLLHNVETYNRMFVMGAAEKYLDSNLELYSGAYLIEDSEASIIQAIDNANMARKLLKERGTSGVQMYEPSMKSNRLKEVALLHMIEEAIEDGEFCVYLQPKISLIDGKLAGAEALARWKKPSGLVAQPGEFIPALEKSGKIVNLDFNMYDMILRQIRDWKNKGVEPVPISINFSRHHIKNPRFVQRLVQLAKAYELDNSLIEIEVTESAFVDNQEALIQVMKDIKDEGFGVSIDDFGKGYSSLSMLTELPADIVKIDKDFLRNSASDSTKGMLNNVIRLIKDNRMKVVCEGIETKEQAEFLNKVGCDLGQGYYFAKPLSIRDFERKFFHDVRA